jgi:hypothetical protein
MPAHGKLHDMRWRLWHKKLLVKGDEDFKVMKCILCGSEEDRSHLLTTCSFGEKVRQTISTISSLLSTYSPTSIQWTNDWIDDNIHTNTNTVICDTLMACTKWGVWKVYCEIAYGGEEKSNEDVGVVINYMYKKLNCVTKALVASKLPKSPQFNKTITSMVDELSSKLTDICIDIYNFL